MENWRFSMPEFRFGHFLQIFIEAIDNVDQQYYFIETSYDPKGIVRERVFCYELYHQLRLMLPIDYPYQIHGELDKHGHREIERQYQKIPDFLLHLPGTHDENNVIIEVKGQLNNWLAVSDLNKIKSFMANVNYKFGIFLLFNHSLQNLFDEIDLTNEKIRRTYRYLFTLNELDEKIFIICSPQNREHSIITLKDLKIKEYHECN